MGALTIHPVPNLRDGRPARLTSGFGPRSGGMTSFHKGGDFLVLKNPDDPSSLPYTEGKWTFPDAKSGEEVPAVASGDGTVRMSNWTGTGYGMWIDHGGGLITKYMHLRERSYTPKVGKIIRAGTPLAAISFNPWKRGAPRATPGNPQKIGLNHLHWETWKNGQPFDPESVYGRNLSKLRRIRNPLEGSFLINIGLAVGAGYVLYKYVFV